VKDTPELRKGVNKVALRLFEHNEKAYHAAVRMMEQYEEVFPGYGFARNKGYGSKEHIEALQTMGPTAIHRRSFIGHFVKEG